MAVQEEPVEEDVKEGLVGRESGWKRRIEWARDRDGTEEALLGLYTVHTVEEDSTMYVLC